MNIDERKLFKIKKAWNDIGYGHLTEQLSEDGWFKIKPGQYLNNPLFEYLKMNRLSWFIRPKSLDGIEKNNGWNRIDWKDSKTYPEYEQTVIWINENCGYPTIASLSDNPPPDLDTQITHWRPINYKAPIY